MAEAPLFFLIAGEASGDLLGARLIEALRKLSGSQTRFVGVGGPRMRAAGLKPLFKQEELAHFGLFELLQHVPHLWRRINETVFEVKRLRPAALITIDAPDFSFRVAQRLKGSGIPLIHYVAPTVWAWRPGRAQKVAGFLDHLMALLPFEPPYFTREGLDCTFVGHPIIESAAGQGDGIRFRKKYNIDIKALVISVLPGSRISEISRLLPIFEKAVARLAFQHPGLHVVMPVTPSSTNHIKMKTADWPAPVTIVATDADKYDAFAASKAALTCSGTVAIELAMSRLPMITAYRVSPVTAFLYRRLIKAKFANLVNIMHDRLIVPELLQENCTPDKLSGAIHMLLQDETIRQRQIDGLASVAGWLGRGSFIPSERAAETIIDTIQQLKADRSGQTFTVLQVVPAMVTGGVERGTVEVTRALVKAGHRAVIASAGGRMVREIEDAGGIHVTLPLNTKNPLTIRNNAGRLADAIHRYKVDIVHARSRAPAWSAYKAAASARKPFVTTFHNAYGAQSWLKRRYNSVMARGLRVIAISDFVGEYAQKTYGVLAEKLRVIPRGVDIEQFDPAAVSADRIATLRQEWHLPEGKPVIMLPGRLTRWKGQLVLIDALAKLGRRDITCAIVGGGSKSFRQEIEQAADKRGLGALVHVYENCRDMPAAYMLADIVVSPATRPEGFGRVIAEAQAMGRPVIATDHGGARETIIPGKTGWLVAPGNAEALAKAIDEALALKPEEREAMAAQSIAHIRQNFTTKAMTDATLAVYRELLQSQAASMADMPAAADMPKSGKERILVIRLGALGDLILCFQAFQEIRAAHPDAEIALLTMPAFADFAKRIPWFDRVIVDPRPSASQPFKWLRLVKDIRKFGPKRIYDLQGKKRQSILFALLGGRLWGPEWSGAAPFCSHPRLTEPSPGMHFTDYVAAQLQLADVQPLPPVDAGWFGKVSDTPLGRFLLPERYAVLVPGCAPHRGYKRWPASNYAALAEKLQEKGIASVVVGTKQDAAAVSAIRAIAPGIIDLAGRTTLFQLAAVMRGATCVIANDTGPMHVAAAVGAPVLGLMSEQVDAAWNAPKGPRAKWLQGQPLSTLEVDKVLLALGEFLDQNK